MEESNKKINILNNQLANEKNKNNILLKDNSNYKNKVEELNSKINKHNNNQKIIPDDIIKLYKKIDDLNEKLKRFPFILEENEKIFQCSVKILLQSMIWRKNFIKNILRFLKLKIILCVKEILLTSLKHLKAII